MPDMTVSSQQSTMNLPTEMSRYELTIGDYWRILVKRKFIVFLTFISVLAGTIAYTNAQTPVYSAASGVRIGQDQNQAFGMDQAALLYTNANPMSIYQNLITSQKVAERVVIRLGLLGPGAQKKDLITKTDEIRDSIATRQIGDTDVLSIVVSYPDPVLAAAIANQTAKVFAEVDLLEKTKKARTIRQFVERQLAFFENKLQTTEDKIQSFRESGKALGLAINLEQRLSELEKSKAILLNQFTEKHPDIMKLEDEVKDVREQISNLPSNELELARLQRDLEINDRAYRTMKERYEAVRLSEVETVSNISVVEEAVPNHKPISPRKNLNKLLGGVIGIILGVILAFGTESIDTSIGTIEDVERTIRLPVIGVVPYFDPLAQDHAWWRVDQHIMQMVKRRVAAGAPSSASLIMNQDTFSTLSEAYRILRTFTEFILEKQVTDGGKILMITSTGPQEGKSLTSCNLAISLAQAGRRTLLIDADLRRPVVHRLFGLKRTPGLADLLLKTATLQDVRCSMGDILIGETSQWDKVIATKMLDRLEIIPTGQATDNPAELMASDAMKDLLRDFRKKYDYIIIDTPPVLPVTDARILGLMADVTFFIYRSGKTARRSLIRAKEELDLAGVKVKGIILNHATAESQLTNREYYQYYGEGNRSKKK